MQLKSLDNIAVTTLYSSHQGWLKEWLRKKLGNTSDAADLAQDTFVRIIKLQNAAEIQEPRTYLATVAKSILIDFIRRKTLERAYLEAIAEMPQAYVPSPEEQLVVMEALFEMDTILNGLGPKVKQTFMLSQFDELSYTQIAEKLDISLRTVNNYMAKAMEHFCMYRLMNRD